MLRRCSAGIAPLLVSGANAAVVGASWTAPGIQQLSTAPHLEPVAAEVQQQLLDAAAKHVQQLGWSRDALAAAARELQLSPACIGMFPRGPSQLVEHVVRSHNQQLAAELAASRDDLLALPLPRRLAWVFRRRLELVAPLVDVWPQALALLAQPRNSAAALALLAQLLDEIWYAAGDSSTDASWYAKRAMLAAIYTSSELYMLTDFSPGFADTWAQLERRLADAAWLGGALSSAAAAPQQLLELLARATARTATPGGGSSSGGGVGVGSSGAGMPAAGQEQQQQPASAAAAAAASSSPQQHHTAEPGQNLADGASSSGTHLA